MNGSYKLSETIPDYLSGIVFQRTHLVSGNVYGTIKFQPAFNLAMVWMIVFVSLSKGLRSYGKVVYVFTLVPVFSTFILCAKLLGLMSSDHMNVIFPETVWNEFFVNPKVSTIYYTHMVHVCEAQATCSIYQVVICMRITVFCTICECGVLRTISGLEKTTARQNTITYQTNFF